MVYATDNLILSTTLGEKRTGHYFKSGQNILRIGKCFLESHIVQKENGLNSIALERILA